MSNKRVVVCGFSPSVKPFDSHHTLPEGVTRLQVEEAFPCHIGVHHFDSAGVPADYCTDHHHDDEGEINIFINLNQMEYAVTVGGQQYRVTDTSAVWIPPGVPHSANLKGGQGIMLCVRLKDGAFEFTQRDRGSQRLSPPPVWSSAALPAE